MTGIQINIKEVIKRNFKDRDRSYNRGRSRDRENRGRFSRNERDSGSRNRGRLTYKDKIEEKRVSLLQRTRTFYKRVSEKEKQSR